MGWRGVLPIPSLYRSLVKTLFAPYITGDYEKVMNRLRTNSHGECMSIPGNSGYNWTVENATKIWLNCGPWAQFWTSSFSVPHESWRYNALYDHFWWTTLKNSATYFNINEANLMILRHETCTLQGDNVLYRCKVTRGFRLMNIQSTRGQVW